jgi:hypothetical protein
VLLPDKHIRLSESIVGFAGLILSTLVRPTTFDTLWKKVRDRLDTPDWPSVHGVDNFVLALGFLYSIEAVEVSDDGELTRCG